MFKVTMYMDGNAECSRSFDSMKLALAGGNCLLESEWGYSHYTIEAIIYNSDKPDEVFNV